MNDYMGTPICLNDIVEYQEGSVVSKTLIKKSAGTLTLFAFDQGQELSEHKAAFDAYIQVLDGEAEIMLSGETHQMSEGQALIMPAHAPHAVKATQRFKMMLVMIKEKKQRD